MKVTYFLTHPIQYQTPLLRALTDAGVDFRVLYASVEKAWSQGDWQEKQPIAWDVPLLGGYDYAVLDNPGGEGSYWQQVSHYRRLLRKWLVENPTEIAWIHGWGNPYSLAALMETNRAGAKLMLRGESHLGCLRGPLWWRPAHSAMLKHLFARTKVFLAIGEANREFYLAYGAPADRIVTMPYVVDNSFFENTTPTGLTSHDMPTAPWPKDDGRPCILFAGKLIAEKSVDVLLRGVHLLNQELPAEKRARVLAVGEGHLREELGQIAKELLPGDVHFLGFQNQSRMPGIYAQADIFVLPSSFEPWGLVVNEAMNAAKPIIVSDRVGARFDLVEDGVNGAVFPTGDAEALAKALKPFVVDADFRKRAGAASLQRIHAWGIPEAVAGFQEGLALLQSSDPQTLSSSRISPATVTQEATTSPVTPKPVPSSAGLVSVAYAYVHNAYQQAQAAEEAGRLGRFYCSCLDAPGQLGQWIGRLVGKEAMASRGGVTLASKRIVENPWPLFRSRIRERLSGANPHEWLQVNGQFDRWLSQHLYDDPSDLLLGYETCAQHTFDAAKSLGKRCLLDCPQFHLDFLWNKLAEAADVCSLPPPPPVDTPEIAARKREEFAIADTLLVYSELHAQSFTEAGHSADKILIAPLWIDPLLWYPEKRRQRQKDEPLKLLFVGGASLRKGIPFLMEAVRACGGKARLSFAGPVDKAMEPFVADSEAYCQFLGSHTKPSLRRIYANHDLLVLPSVLDAFGFVAMEAMACGTPVLVSETCGVPVPDPAWKVPPLNAEVLRHRFQHYIDHPDQLESDGQKALEFARGFTAEKFRGRMLECFDLALKDKATR